MLTCVIIDDEQYCVDALTAMLSSKFADAVVVVGSTTDSRKATALIAEHRPQIVFVDIEMPYISGIQLMYAFPVKSFSVIYTTAHDKYALQAIKAQALDYLLKPIDLRELGEAISKVSESASSGPAGNTVGRKEPAKKLLLPTGAGLFAASISEIIRIEASSNYSNFYLSGKSRIVVSKTLKEYEEMLAPSDFFRVHQSHLINLHHVEYFRAGIGDFVTLSNGDAVEVSRRRKAEFLQKLAAL